MSSNYTGGSIPGTKAFENEPKGLSTSKVGKNNGKRTGKSNNKKTKKKENKGKAVGKVANVAAGIVDKIVKSRQQDYSAINKNTSSSATTERTGAAWDTSAPTGSKSEQKKIWREGDLS